MCKHSDIHIEEILRRLPRHLSTEVEESAIRSFPLPWLYSESIEFRIDLLCVFIWAESLSQQLPLWGWALLVALPMARVNNGYFRCSWSLLHATA